MITLTGKCSCFGGPTDSGVGTSEGLALVSQADLSNYWFDRLFEPAPLWHKLFGLARNLNPNALYCAMRWDQVFGESMETAEKLARGAMIRVFFCGKSVWVQGVDYGPGDGSVIDGVKTENTGRLIDLSPGAAAALGVATDGVVTVEVYP